MSRIGVVRRDEVLPGECYKHMGGTQQGVCIEMLIAGKGVPALPNGVLE